MKPLGLQQPIKIAWIDLLSVTGLPVIERPVLCRQKWVPQLADHQAVLTGIHQKPGVVYPVFVPNQKGFENAVAAGAHAVSFLRHLQKLFARKIFIVRSPRVWLQSKASCSRRGPKAFLCVRIFPVWWAVLMKGNYPRLCRVTSGKIMATGL